MEVTPAPKKRIRRTEDQLIADLQAEIERLKTKAAVKAVKKDPSTKHTADAVRHIDQALATATNVTQREALTEARMALVSHLQFERIKILQNPGRGRPKPTARSPSAPVSLPTPRLMCVPGKRKPVGPNGTQSGVRSPVDEGRAFSAPPESTVRVPLTRAASRCCSRLLSEFPESRGRA